MYDIYLGNAGSLSVNHCVKTPFTVLLVSEHVHGLFSFLHLNRNHLRNQARHSRTSLMAPGITSVNSMQPFSSNSFIYLLYQYASAAHQHHRRRHRRPDTGALPPQPWHPIHSLREDVQCITASSRHNTTRLVLPAAARSSQPR